MQKIALAVIQNTQGHVLIIKRKIPEESKTLTKLSWAFPGGRPEKQENMEQTVIREIKEEVGLYVKIKSKLSSRQHPDFPVEITYFACETTSNQQAIPDDDEVSEILWVSPKKLKQYLTQNISPDVQAYLRV